MGNDLKTSGSVKEFDVSWRKRKESLYNHWTPNAPKNQVQFAFWQHWDFFQSLIGKKGPGKSLEVGCGRGTLSSYFAAAGWTTVLLDWSSAVLGIAEAIFETNGHEGSFIAGDANALPFRNEQFDVVASIGLLEHFENVSQTIEEQWRILNPGGLFLAYIVPERPDNIQRYFNWINFLLKQTIGRVLERKNPTLKKEEIFRNDYSYDVYVNCLKKYYPEELLVTGMYPVPMISHSPEFPFSLLPASLEAFLVWIFGFVVTLRRIITGKHGWLCSEKLGQAFLVAARKRERE